ncbi:hypothetical protein [Streptomyces sp. NPDC056821]|uniref:hypothetical protein n=1 Tax=unclassified Streptomyces TaxID=2593676 RepID=UPI0036A1014E
MRFHISRIAALAASLIITLPISGCSNDKTTCYSGAFCGNGNKGNSIGAPTEPSNLPSAPTASETPTTSSKEPEPPPSDPIPERNSPTAPAATTPEAEGCGTQCKWRDWPKISGVQVRPNWVREGDDFYMVAEWRSSPEMVLDVWIWLRDNSGRETLYPVDPPAIGFYQARTNSKGFSEKVKVGIKLEHGRHYNVSMYVLEYKPNQAKPNISNPEVTGLMTKFLYT